MKKDKQDINTDKNRNPVGRNPDTGSHEHQRFPVIEEQLSIEKQEVTKGQVQLKKEVEKQNEDVTYSLLEEDVEVKRVPFNEFVDNAPPAVRTEGEYTIVSVVKEVLVKRLVLVEEVHIRKNVLHKEERMQFPLRKEKIKITRQKGDHE